MCVCVYMRIYVYSIQIQMAESSNYVSSMHMAEPRGQVIM